MHFPPSVPEIALLFPSHDLVLVFITLVTLADEVSSSGISPLPADVASF